MTAVRGDLVALSMNSKRVGSVIGVVEDFAHNWTEMTPYGLDLTLGEAVASR
jgi:hypothetical protein